MGTPHTTPPPWGPLTQHHPHGHSSPSIAAQGTPHPATPPIGIPHIAPPLWAPLTQHHPCGHPSPSYTPHGYSSSSNAPMGTPHTAPPPMGTPHPAPPLWAPLTQLHAPWVLLIQQCPHGHTPYSSSPHGHPSPSYTSPWVLLTQHCPHGHTPIQLCIPMGTPYLGLPLPWAPPTHNCPPKGTAHPRHWVPPSASLLTLPILTPLALGLCPSSSLPAHTGSLSAWGCSTLMLGSVSLVVAAEDTEAGQGKWPPALGPSRFFSLTVARSCTPRSTVMATWTVTPRCSASVKASARSWNSSEQGLGCCGFQGST
ncbi:arginine-glutamic acid dipeptide repeats protein-like [Trachemys scripta elegans]|uniref:arginine-glutamic acid dipeptide repeats protein-like n=1 Tax=Trachemys scripta elegans TaxID=31138 RepID=UPI001555FE4D|nr:arginine-glutamic acid dipeptide repeats protein-like [Trachemys scripta elegans]